MNIDTTHLIKTSSVKYDHSGNESIFRREFNISIFPGKDQFKSSFFTETAVLISSGLDLKRTLEIVASGFNRKKERKIIDFIIASIIKGYSFSKAMDESDIFSMYDVHSVRIGEQSGTLSIVLNDLSGYYSKKISQFKMVRGALTYPILIIITTIVCLVFMLKFIVPMFQDIFSRFRGELPVLTRFILSLSDSFNHYFFSFVLIISLIIIVHIKYQKNNMYRKISSYVIMKTPIIGKIVILHYKTRFCQTLKLLTESRVNLMDSIVLIKKMIGFYPFEVALNTIEKKLSAGISLSQAMESFSIFDTKLIAMTRVAEEVNKLDLVYDQLYIQYSDELDTKIKTLNNLLEPVLIIIVGGVVAFILVSMYLPIFQIGTTIN